MSIHRCIALLFVSLFFSDIFYTMWEYLNFFFFIHAFYRHFFSRTFSKYFWTIYQFIICSILYFPSFLSKFCFYYKHHCMLSANICLQYFQFGVDFLRKPKFNHFLAVCNSAGEKCKTASQRKVIYSI